MLDRIEQFDGYSMPFEDAAFDTAACVHVLEHVEHERLFLGELGRIARRAYIEVPLEGGLRGRIDRCYGHIKHYTPKTALNLFETSGLRVLRWQVLTHSAAYERFGAGQFGGTVRHLVRHGLLAAAGVHRAPEIMTYLFGALVERA